METVATDRIDRTGLTVEIVGSVWYSHYCKQLVCSELRTSAQRATNRPSSRCNSHDWARATDRPSTHGASWKLRHTPRRRWACV